MTNRILRSLLAIGLTTWSAGCEQFLEPEPQTFASSTTYYNTPAQMEQAVNSLYGDMRGLFTGGGGPGSWRVLGDMRADLVTLQFNINIPGFTFQIDEFTEATGDNNVADAYGPLFNTIFDANVILSRIDGVTFANPAQKERIIAEAKFIRALAFFQGVNYFGLGQGWAPNNLAIPLLLQEVTEPAQALQLERATVQQVVDQIIKDLTESKPALPVKGGPGGTAGRITRGAAAFLLGATYQLNPSPASQRLALKEFEELASQGGYALITAGSGTNNAFRQVFNPANKNNAESILEVQFLVTSENGALRQNLVPNQAPLNSAGGGNAGNAQRISVYGASGEGQYLPTQNHVLSFSGAKAGDAVTDLRYAGGYGLFCPGSGTSGVLGVADVQRPGSDPALSSPNTAYPEVNIAQARDPQNGQTRNNCIAYFTKWRWPEQMPQSGRDNNNWIVYRYADALLRRAEAHWRLGENTQAVALLNQVRRRAGLPDLGALSGTPLRDAILQERAWELAGEGHRWFDLKRFGAVNDVMGPHVAERRARVARTSPSAYQFTGASAFRLRYPIRPRDVELSQCRIKQNPGWGGCEGT